MLFVVPLGLATLPGKGISPKHCQRKTLSIRVGLDLRPRAACEFKATKNSRHPLLMSPDLRVNLSNTSRSRLGSQSIEGGDATKLATSEGWRYLVMLMIFNSPLVPKGVTYLSASSSTAASSAVSCSLGILSDRLNL